MFIEGKKFPHGQLSPFKWRIYVYDIVKFVTNERFMFWFIDFDPDCYFQLMKLLFTQQEVYEFLTSQKGFIDMYSGKVAGLEQCFDH